MKRSRGRPRRFGGTVSIRLETDLHDALSRRAHRQRVQLSDLMRGLLRSSLTESEFRISKIDTAPKSTHTASTSTHD